jgi:hypothetical protein
MRRGAAYLNNTALGVAATMSKQKPTIDNPLGFEEVVARERSQVGLPWHLGMATPSFLTVLIHTGEGLHCRHAWKGAGLEAKRDVGSSACAASAVRVRW